MCNAYCILFGAINLQPEEVQGKKVLEVGSYETNGSLRPLIESYIPAQYTGVDIQNGPGVDVICKAEDILEVFGKESFDVIISTELLEHIRDWRKAINNFKDVCKIDGIILVTTRSYGCPYHGHPYDFWRYEIDDMKRIFSDCIIEKLEKDPLSGVFAKMRKPKSFVISDLSDYELYSILLNKRVEDIDEKDIQRHTKRLILREKTKNLISSIRRLIV
jgi:SAM-dependent methyltransferase